MAKKEKFNMRGSFYDTVNVHYRVGSAGENRFDDVLLVQAMFRLIAHGPGVSVAAQLGISVSGLPELTGSCDAKTQSSILAFQRKHGRQLLNVDGVIHPARYENRRLNYPSGFRLMAITLLNQIALECWPIDRPDGSDYIQGLVQLEPRLKPALA